MSTIRTDYGVTFDVSVGVTKTLEIVITDPDTGENKLLTDTDIYHSGIARILKPDGTQIGNNMNISFGEEADRDISLVSFIVHSNSHTLPENAGNWVGEIEIHNLSMIAIEKQKFNLNIIG